MDNSEAKELLLKYESSECTAKEIALLESWFIKIKSEQGAGNVKAKDLDMDLEQVWLALNSKINKKRTKLWPRIGVAAAVIGLAIGVYFYTTPYPELVSGSPTYANDIAPGKNTATLTSSNGNTINLSEAKTGVAIDATALTYNDGTKIDPSALGMTDGDSRALEVITPKGGTYSIILQDGTKVWLNADSKLEFLSNYRNKLQRIVKLTGEGYFEVAKVFSPGKAGRGPERVPFIVESNGQRVEVLGTHFNISAYKGEAIKTTLLEGSVKVNETMLKPNQQSLITQNGSITVTEANPNATAWVDGKFRFQKTPLQDVLKEMARWYDVEIVYPDGIPNENLSGGINRDINLSEALYIMKNMHVKFRIEGKKIIVSK